MAWLAGWTFRKSKIIGASEVVANYTVTGGTAPLKLHTGNGADDNTNFYFNGQCKGYFDDVRITSDDGATLLSYALRPIDATTAELCVKTTIGAAPITIYIYYGNATATRYSDWAATFLEGMAAPPRISIDVTNKYNAGPSICREHTGTLHCVYTKGLTHFTNEDGGQHKTSTDGGRTWSLPVQISGNDHWTTGISEFVDNVTGQYKLIVTGYTWAPLPEPWIIWAKISVDGGVNWGANSPNYNDGNYITIASTPAAGDIYNVWNGVVQVHDGAGASLSSLLLPAFLLDASDANHLYLHVFKSTDNGVTWADKLIGNAAAFDSSEPSIVEVKTAGAFTGALYCTARKENADYSTYETYSVDFGEDWGTNAPNYNDNTLADSGLDQNRQEKAYVFRAASGPILLYAPRADSNDGWLQAYKGTDNGPEITWDTANYSSVERFRHTADWGDFFYASACEIEPGGQIGVVYYEWFGAGANPYCGIYLRYVELNSFHGKYTCYAANESETYEADDVLFVQGAALAVVNRPVTGGVAKYITEFKSLQTTIGAGDQYFYAGRDNTPDIGFAFIAPSNAAQTTAMDYNAGFENIWLAYAEGTTYIYKITMQEDIARSDYWIYNTSWVQQATNANKAPAAGFGTIEHIHLSTGSAVSTANVKIYWLTIRKYTPTEPQWGATGGETTGPAKAGNLAAKLRAIGAI